ncbi:hypothetical protein [Novosphingobium jiangmenense]|uniref:Uncharacterized protein n=1 Tax=Novosphingobium jiangmenense TaxID=2791981 RepID=A0ABS0HHY5_9SPHN|nr:hypothetical protein [Novosphingobium jiangmenense]MBF9151811.1 hypothetical protein [Novosphingobium jiangmenense]
MGDQPDRLSGVLNLKCLFGFHRPVRSKVVRKLMYYTGPCQGCGKPIRRLRRGRWHVYRDNADRD